MAAFIRYLLPSRKGILGLRRIQMKKLVATVAALAFAASLTACGEAGEKAAEETTEAAEATGDAMEAGAENAMTAAEDTADATAEAAGDATAEAGAAVEEVGKDMQKAAE
jgi:predicted small lipoprotein YifL